MTDQQGGPGGTNLPETANALGEPLSSKSKVLESAAGVMQNLAPIKSICAHLNAFHVYADGSGRCIEANHYCSHINEDLRQCLIYDTDQPNARLIGVEYMVTPRVFETLPEEERKLWHSHVFEVKSGMLCMPTPSGVPNAAWEVAETSEMREIIPLYGKTYHMWQVDRGDKVPLGPPQLMGSFTQRDQLDFEQIVGDRDQRYGVDSTRKAELRKDIPDPETHNDADVLWTPPGKAKKADERGGLDTNSAQMLKNVHSK